VSTWRQWAGVSPGVRSERPTTARGPPCNRAKASGGVAGVRAACGSDSADSGDRGMVRAIGANRARRTGVPGDLLIRGARPCIGAIRTIVDSAFPSIVRPESQRGTRSHGCNPPCQHGREICPLTREGDVEGDAGSVGTPPCRRTVDRGYFSDRPNIAITRVKASQPGISGMPAGKEFCRCIPTAGWQATSSRP